MGGAVSSGKDNNELVDNLVGGNYIRSKHVEKVFRALDRAEYMTLESRDQAYKDLAWRNGPLHLSAPCIYSEVMEALELKPGLSFLNVGSGTGYLSTMVALVIGAGGINHGVEVHPTLIEYSNTKNNQFIENSVVLDEFDFCEPKYYLGNGLRMAPLQTPYDRVYCGAKCPSQYVNYFKQLIKVGGILVMPMNDSLVQIRRNSQDMWTTRKLLNVSFASLRTPSPNDKLIKLDEQCPPRLQVLARSAIRRRVRVALVSRHAHLRERPRPPLPHRPDNCPRRICIPIDDEADIEGLNALHDLDQSSGANEMNALLSLVLSMGHNRVAGSLSFDSVTDDSDRDSEREDDDHAQGVDGAGGVDDADGVDGADVVDGADDADDADEGGEDDDDDEGDDDDDADDGDEGDDGDDDDEGGDNNNALRFSLPNHMPTCHGGPSKRLCRGLLTFEFQDATLNTITGTVPDANTASECQSWTNSMETDSPVCEHEASPPAPAEAETCRPTGGIDWERARQIHISDDETENSMELKSVKVDSGIGEENSTPSGSPPSRDKGKSDDSSGEAGMSDSPTDDMDQPLQRGRRRREKRSHNLISGEGGDGEGGGGVWGPSCRCGGPPRRGSLGPDARRIRLSVLMRRALRDLPLPYALKKYVNYGRYVQH